MLYRSTSITQIRESAMNKDSLSGLVLLALAAAYYWATGAIADSTLSDEVGAIGLPRVLTVALAGLGLILIVRSLLTAEAGQGGPCRRRRRG